MAFIIKTSPTPGGGEGGTKVVCRVRPRTKAEANHKSCVHVRGREVSVKDPCAASSSTEDGATSTFTGTFDDVFAEESTNEHVFASLLPTLEDVRKGYNGAILAYGQSGAGKTHTMNGYGGGDDVSELGIIPRAIAHLASHRDAVEASGADCHLSFTAVELYQEKLRDLMSPQARL